MAYRSEGNRIPNKQYYTDLNLTHYPSALDTRTNNVNMKGFVNVGEQSIPDYVMAEYVNSLADAVMAIERALGINPMVPTGAPANKVSEFIRNKTVSDRLAAIEGGDLDERYGGSGWKYLPNRPTLNNHNHDGLNGHPGKINLQTEVEGKLRKGNIDLTLATGLTGSDIFVSSTNATTIANSLADALSKRNGGTVLGRVNFSAGVKTLTNWEFRGRDFLSLSGATLVTDNQGNNNQAVRAEGTAAAVFHKDSLNNTLMYGKYVIGVRVKVSAKPNQNVLKISTGSNNSTFIGTEFKTANKYQMVYHVFDHESVQELKIEKLAGASAVTVSIDGFFIQPVHPAVFDR